MATFSNHPLPDLSDSRSSSQEQRFASDEQMVRTTRQMFVLLLIATVNAFMPLFLKKSDLLVAIFTFMASLLSLVIFFFQQTSPVAGGAELRFGGVSIASSKPRPLLEWFRVAILLFSTLLMIQLFTHSFQGTVDELVHNGFMTVTDKGYAYLSTVFGGMLALLVWAPASMMTAMGARNRLGNQPSFVYLGSAVIFGAVSMRFYNYGSSFLSGESVASALGTSVGASPLSGDQALFAAVALLLATFLVVFQTGIMWLAAKFVGRRDH